MSEPLIEKTTGWRGTREIWIEAAYQALLESGIDGVKVMPLADRLGLSRTSFYGHFSDRDDLLNALITLWQSKNTGNLVKRTEDYAETITEAILNLFDLWLMPDLFDSRLEFAVRNWAHTDPDLANLLEEADRVRVGALQSMFERFGYEPAYAHAGFWRLDAPYDLRAYFTNVVGYEERRLQTNKMIEAASLTIPLVISFSVPFQIGIGHRPTADDAVPSFVAGLCGTPVFIRSNGEASCFQVNFTPLGARRFFNLPMDELTGRMLPASDIIDAETAEFVRQIEDLNCWTDRLRLGLDFVCGRLRKRLEPATRSEAAYRQLLRSGGQKPISALAEDLGWSRKHLVAQFRKDIGRPPKAVARVIRFNQLFHLATSRQNTNWSGIAFDCGYSDQAHLIRDFVEFTGFSPTAWQKFSRANSAPSW
eukprot:g1487.t1